MTVAVNVPLNNQLAALSPTSPATPAHWQHFITVWTLANHARAVLSLTACALLATALLHGAPAGRPGASQVAVTERAVVVSPGSMP